MPGICRSLLALITSLLLLQVVALALEAVYVNSHVIQLHRYLHRGQAYAEVRRALVPSHPEGGQWAFVERSNLASGLPSDFVVVRVASDEVLDVLRAAEVVRRVTSQGMHVQALASDTGRDRGEKPFGESRFLPKAPFGAAKLWASGARGQGVRVAVFDTGISLSNDWFHNVVERTDWTEEDSLEDRVGHGTFVAGLIGGSHPRCPGLAPDVELLSFRVFSGSQISYTSWFLDAFNYALQVGVDVVNLSIGGPDSSDEPFTDKIRELAASGVVVVSAIGNDGPLWGSLNSPADMMEVVGVGGAEPTGTIASFSSRGMTTHELGLSHMSYGRVKPDLVAYGRSLSGPSHTSPEAYRRLSGTSVASPVVAGAIALLASLVPSSRRAEVVNPASVKRALLASSRRLGDSSMYEQGAGLLDIAEAATEMLAIDGEYLAHLRDQKSRGRETRSFKTADAPEKRPQQSGMGAYAFPSFIDLTEEGCPYMWPHCAQGISPGALPVTLNVTILNPGGILGVVEDVEYIECSNGQHLHVDVTKPETFWPWSGGLGVHLSVPATSSFKKAFTSQGMLRVQVRSVLQDTVSYVELPIRARIVKPLPREKRLLWDMFHSVRYPPGYVPRDSLSEPRETLDWLGDHPHTNYHAVSRFLFKKGYHIDILNQPLSCLSKEKLDSYGALVLVDSEDYFMPEEVRTIEVSVRNQGLGLVVLADWYNMGVMRSCSFEDDNTRSLWVPICAGANVPSLNEVLHPFGIGFGNTVVTGSFGVNGHPVLFESGNAIARFPAGGELVFSNGFARHPSNSGRRWNSSNIFESTRVPLLGIARVGKGGVAVYGDSNCIDTAYKGASCHEMLMSMIEGVVAFSDGVKHFQESSLLSHAFGDGINASDAPARPMSAKLLDVFRPHSRTLEAKGVGTLLFRSIGSLCAQGGALLSPVRVRQRFNIRGCVAQWPKPVHAHPVGSTENYYTRLHAWRFDTWRTGNGVASLLNLFSRFRAFIGLRTGEEAPWVPGARIFFMCWVCLFFFLAWQGFDCVRSHLRVKPGYRGTSTPDPDFYPYLELSSREESGQNSTASTSPMGSYSAAVLGTSASLKHLKRSRV